MLQNLALILVLASLVWLLFLTIVFWRMLVHYNRLTGEGAAGGLRGVLDGVLKAENDNKKAIEILSENYARIDKEGQFHIQKVGLLRFNPFKDTGGDQSFILSLVDNNDTGVIISGLYSRSGVRWYAKKVQHGRGVEHELSDEERKALKEASKV
jgi:hypothetical protein